MISYIIWAIVLYILFRFIFNFVIPLVRAGKVMRRQMHEFQEKMNQQHQPGSFQENVNAYNGRKEESAKKEGDYIDFEEVK